MGWLTTEELVYDAKGRLATHAPATYKIPVASDVPLDLQHAPSYPRQSDAEHLPFEGGRRAAADARDLGLFGDPRRRACDESEGPAAARSAVHAGVDPQCDPLADGARGEAAPMLRFPPSHRCDRSRRVGGAGDASPRPGIEPARGGRAHGGEAVRGVSRHDRRRSAGVGRARGCARGAESKGAARRCAARWRWGRSSRNVAAAGSNGASRRSIGATSTRPRRSSPPPSAADRRRLKAAIGSDGRIERRLEGDRRGEDLTAGLPGEGVWTEPLGESARAVYLFGAGHVGRALALALAPLPFAVRWIDSRREAFRNTRLPMSR